MSGSRSSAGDETPEGYSWHSVEPMPGTYRFIELLLPTGMKEARRVAEALEAERLAVASDGWCRRRRCARRSHVRRTSQIWRLAWMTPRQIRMASERALGAAAYEGRRRFKNRDFDAPKPHPQVAAASRQPKDGGGDEIAVFLVRS